MMNLAPNPLHSDDQLESDNLLAGTGDRIILSALKM